LASAILFAIIAASNVQAALSHGGGFLARAEPVLVIVGTALLAATVISIPLLRANGEPKRK
jgi:hypothetical protein